jgi:rhamnosyltransferase
MTSSQKLISCIIRSYNEIKHIERLFRALRSQDIQDYQMEVIVIDSGSTDGTVDAVKKLDVKLYEIPKKEFGYSSSLNYAIEKSHGEFILIVSAHTLPADNTWLSCIMKHFTDNEVAGVYCRQIPWPDAVWQEKIRTEDMFGTESCLFAGSGVDSKMHFSNAGSCIRRTLWSKHRFANVPAAEDFEWANWAIAQGFKIAYEANALLFHSHNESCREIARRVITIEKNHDIKRTVGRTFFLTLKQAAGWFIRDMQKVMNSKHCAAQRLSCMCDCLKQSYWFLVDFE